MNKSTGKIPVSAFCGCVLLWVTVAAGAAVRLIQLFGGAIDFKTGFYNDHFSVPLLSAVLWAGCILSVGAMLLCKRVSFAKQIESKKSFLLTTTYVITAVLCGVQAAGYAAASMLTKMQLGKTWVRTLDLAAAGLLFLSVFAFVSFARKNRSGGKSGIAALMPILYAGTKLMQIFMDHTTIANISVYLFEVLFYAFALLFLMTVAKYAMGYSHSYDDKVLIVTGVLTAVFGGVIIIPDYTAIVVSMFVNTGELASFVYPPHLDLIGITLTAFVILGVVLKSSAKNNEAE